MSFRVDSFGRSYYEPSTFYVRINSEYVDEKGFPKPEHRPVFCHEYAHLIQDATTCQGMIEFIHFTDLLQDVLRAIKRIRREDEVALPLVRQGTDGDLYSAQLEKIRAAVTPLTLWERGAIWAFIDFEVRSLSFPLLGRNVGVEVVIAHFVDNVTGDTYEHEIGVREIHEAYSMAVESIHLGKDCVYDKDMGFEYCAVERILSKEFGQVANDQMVAICHWALQDVNPGVNLVELVEYLKADFQSLPGAVELYDALRGRFKRGFIRLPDEIRGNFQEVLDTQKQSGEADALYRVYAWYRDGVLKHLDLLTDNERRFPLDTVLCNPGMSLESLYSAVPIPILETYDNIGHSYGVFDESTHSAYVLRSLTRLTAQLWNGTSSAWECPWWDICGRSRIQFRDEQCRVTPWVTAAHRPCCPYGTAAAYLGLDQQTAFVPWTPAT